ncbi:ferritin-like domain-containing protein [Affinirhizobium pseudoryzae]|uniref:ferritin-like domain-containing protein n=1 Tax=Allorhizobium pseudoryzae TaxID=379684 RepID=UPI0013ED5FF9|nr:ferritin-like domain-containing protein [Allorhizobium pseudoryzae]
MTHSADHFLAWLRDAHAMEVQAISQLRSQIGRIESYPDLKARLHQHLGETEEQERALKALLDRTPQGHSALKDITSRLSAAAQGVGTLFSAAEVVKASMAAYAFEHTEIATYKVLIAAADELGDQEARQVFEQILAQEIAMANWLEEQIDTVTRLYLMRDERDLQARR